MQVWYKVQNWGSDLNNNWHNTLQQAANANNMTNSTMWVGGNSSSYSPYNNSNYTSYNSSSGYNNSSTYNTSNSSMSSNSTMNMTVGNTTASTGSKHCYYTASLNTRCSSTNCTNWCDRQNAYSNAAARCLNNSYGGVDYGCRWGYGTSD